MGWGEDHHSFSLCHFRFRLLFYLTWITISRLHTVLLISVVFFLMSSCHISSLPKAGKARSTQSTEDKMYYKSMAKGFPGLIPFPVIAHVLYLIDNHCWTLPLDFHRSVSFPTAPTQAVAGPTLLTKFIPPVHHNCGAVHMEPPMLF